MFTHDSKHVTKSNPLNKTLIHTQGKACAYHVCSPYNFMFRLVQAFVRFKGNPLLKGGVTIDTTSK